MAQAAPELDPDDPAEPGPESSAESAGGRRAAVVLPVYVPDGFAVRRQGAPSAGVGAGSRENRKAFVTAVALTMVAGILMGYITGFAVARRTAESKVNVTVTQTDTP